MEKLLIGLAGVIVGAILTLLREFFKEWRVRRNDFRYLAVRLTCLLDRLVSECCDIVRDDGYPDISGRLMPLTSPPALSFKDLDVNWQSLKIDLMYKILDLPNRIEEANLYISNEYEHGDGPPGYTDFYAARKGKYASIGLEAYEISKLLRKKSAIPEKNYGDWNPIRYLLEAKDRYD